MGEVASDLQIVTFSIAEQYFGIDILSVSEIINLTKITPLAQAPEYVEGVINIRGQIIPALNLHMMFNNQSGKQDDANRIMVVESRNVLFGLIVDAVSEVKKVTDDMIKPTPPAISIQQNYLQGIVLDKEHLIALIDLNKLLPEQDMEDLKKITD